MCYLGFCLLGDGEGGDLSWVSVVLAIKGSVHGEFAPEDQLALPSVPWRHPQIHTQTSRIKQLEHTHHSDESFVCAVFPVKPQFLIRIIREKCL